MKEVGGGKGEVDREEDRRGWRRLVLRIEEEE